MVTGNMKKTREQIIKEITDKFLGWKLPKTFNPDGGISFTRKHSVGTPYESEHEPFGTNLFTATEAKEMLQYLLSEITLSAKVKCEWVPCGEDAKWLESSGDGRLIHVCTPHRRLLTKQKKIHNPE